MNFLKKTLSLLLCLLLICTVTVLLAACNDTDDGGDDAGAQPPEEPVNAENSLIYHSNGDGTCAIVGHKAFTETFDAVTIPEKSPAGDTVVAIGDSNSTSSDAQGEYGVDFGRYRVKHITFPKTLKTINESAFYGNVTLEKITLSAESQLETLGANAFFKCTNLAAFAAPTSLKKIGGSAFAGCTKLATVTFNEGLESIGKSAFAGCTALTSAKLPNGLLELDWNAFENCTALEEVEIGTGLKTLGASVFKNTKWLNQKLASESIVYAYGYLVAVKENLNIKEFTLNANCKLMCDDVFSQNATLETVVIPANSVATISAQAFNNCKKLRKVTIGEGVTEIGKSAFFFNQESTYFYDVSLPASLKTVGYGAFMSVPSTIKIAFAGTQEQWNAITYAGGSDVIKNSNKVTFGG